MIAHVGGLPVEETIIQLAPAGVGMLVALRLGADRIHRTVRRRRAHREPAQREPVPPSKPPSRSPWK